MDLLSNGPIKLPSIEDESRAAERAMTIYLKLRMEKLQTAEGVVPQRTEDEISDEYGDLATAANDVSIKAHRLRKGLQ